MMNIKQFVKAVNKMVDKAEEHYKFYLTLFGSKEKNECYFLDDMHHGFMNGVIILKDDVLIIKTLMHE